MKTVEEMCQVLGAEVRRRARVDALIARGISSRVWGDLYWLNAEYAMLERVEALTPEQIVALNEAAA